MTGEIRGRERPHGRLKRHYPPNCTMCDLGPSRFLAFRAKQREVEAKYGFRLGVPCRTPEQREGHRRYTSDWQRRYRAERPVEERRAYMNARTVREKRIREREEAQAARVAEIRNARETFAAEREANRAAYLAAKAERGERAAVPRSPSFIVPPVEPPGGKIGTGVCKVRVQGDRLQERLGKGAAEHGASHEEAQVDAGGAQKMEPLPPRKPQGV